MADRFGRPESIVIDECSGPGEGVGELYGKLLVVAGDTACERGNGSGGVQLHVQALPETASSSSMVLVQQQVPSGPQVPLTSVPSVDNKATE